MSRLAQAGDSSTASPGLASPAAWRTASRIEVADTSSTPVSASTRPISGPSCPINTTARAWRDTTGIKGEKSWPLPCPPAISTTCWPMPSSAATVAPTLVPLLSLM